MDDMSITDEMISIAGMIGVCGSARRLEVYITRSLAPRYGIAMQMGLGGGREAYRTCAFKKRTGSNCGS